MAQLQLLIAPVHAQWLGVNACLARVCNVFMNAAAAT